MGERITKAAVSTNGEFFLFFKFSFHITLFYKSLMHKFIADWGCLHYHVIKKNKNNNFIIEGSSTF